MTRGFAGGDVKKGWVLKVLRKVKVPMRSIRQVRELRSWESELLKAHLKCQ